MNALLAAGLMVIAFLTLVGCYVFGRADIARGTKLYLIGVSLCMMLIEILSAVALIGTIG